MSRENPIIMPRPFTRKSGPIDESEAGPICGNLYQAALELAQKRGDTLGLLKAAILREDTREVYQLSAKLCGLGNAYEPPLWTRRKHETGD